MAQWLEHWIFNWEDPGSIPRKNGIFFQLCFIPLLRLSCRKSIETAKMKSYMLENIKLEQKHNKHSMLGKNFNRGHSSHLTDLAKAVQHHASHHS